MTCIASHRQELKKTAWSPRKEAESYVCTYVFEAETDNTVIR